MMAFPAPARIAVDSALKVSDDGRYLTDQTGAPFFYLADTAWTLFKRLTPEEVETYLANRAAKGFSVIQAYVLRGLEVRNLDGHLPLIDRDPTRLNEGFFRNIDHIVARANAHGLAMALVATMGEHVTRKDKSERFRDRNEQIFDAANARVFGELLGRRYRDACVIWLLGGDRTPNPADVAIWDAMAEGLKAGCSGRHLVSYHSSGGHSSSETFHASPWLDFNTVQSRHASADPNYLTVAADYALHPVKPTFDMECRYEDHPDHKYLTREEVFSDQIEPKQRVDAYQVRLGAYWAVFAGAAGHGYGHNDIWQMHDPGRADSTADYSFPFLWPRLSWRRALDSDGAFGMAHLRKLVEMRPWYRAAPAPDLVLNQRREGEDVVQALAAGDERFVLVHSSISGLLELDLGRFGAGRFIARWFDPATGQITAGGEILAKRVTLALPAPLAGRDSVLILDDIARPLPSPH